MKKTNYYNWFGEGMTEFCDNARVDKSIYYKLLYYNEEKYVKMTFKSILRVIICLAPKYEESVKLLKTYLDFDISSQSKRAKVARAILRWIDHDCSEIGIITKKEISDRYVIVQEFLNENKINIHVE